MKKILNTLGLLLLFSATAFAQQRYISTLGAINGFNNNPAYAGINNCLNINLQEKKQWVNVPNSPANTHFQLSKRFGRILGLGFQSNYWTAALLSNFQSSATGAFHLPLTRSVKLSIGTSFGFSQVSLNTSDMVVYQNESSIQKQNVRTLFCDFGLLLHSNKFQVGIASPSLFNTRIGGNNQLNYTSERYLVANAQYTFPVNKRLSLSPIVVYRSIPAAGYLVDGMLRADLNNRIGASVGYRTNSGMLVAVDLKISKKLSIAYAYDAGFQNLNGLSKGSHEILLGLSFCKEEPKPKYIQRFAEITVIDENGTLAANKSFTIKNNTTGVLQTVKTTEKGLLVYPIDTLSTYAVTNNDANYETTSIEFSTPNKLSENIKKEFTLLHKTAIVKGKIVNNETGVGIPDVVITKTENGQLVKYVTDENGEYQIPLENNNLNDSIRFSLSIEKDEFLKIDPLVINTTLTQYGELQLAELSNGTMKEIELTPYKVGGTINEIIAINPIYFDYNQSDIRPDAALELEKVIQVLKENPTLTIEVGAHSDCTGNAESNQRLSERRAQACVSFIQKQLENPKRITGKGYGESVPLSTVPCEKRTNEDMAKDRRIEFKIVNL